MLPTLTIQNALAALAFSFLIGAGWTAGCWVLHRLGACRHK